MAAASPRPVLIGLPASEPVPPSSAEPSLLLRVEEAARLLSLSRTTVYELVKSGDLPAVHHGRTTRVPRCALDEWILRQTAKATSAKSAPIT